VPSFSRDLRDAWRSRTRSPGSCTPFALAALAAAFGPARRASRSDPIRALRQE